jgi:hypothetical protein
MLIFFTHKKKTTWAYVLAQLLWPPFLAQEETIDLPFSYQVNLSWGKPLWGL